MQRATVQALVVLVVCAAFPASASPSEPSLEFGSPANVIGQLDVQGLEWAIVVFQAPGVELDFDLASIAAVTDHQHLAQEGQAIDPVLAPGNTVVPLADPTSNPNRPAKGHATFAPGFTSIVIQAQDLALNVSGTALVSTPSSQTRVAEFLPYASIPVGTYRDSPTPEQDSVAVGIDRAGTLRLEATGITFVEWFGAIPECETDYCPPGGGRTHLADSPRSTTQLYSYVELQPTGGRLQLVGEPVVVAVGGRAIDLDGVGQFRLPRANMAGQCGKAECPDPDGQTLRLNGSVALSNLRRVADSDRMTTQASGDVRQAFMDETPFGPFTTRQATVGVAAVGLALLLKLALAFFSRHEGPVLDLPGVRAIHEQIAAKPGISFSELQRATETGSGQLARALRKLEGEHLVVARPYRNTKCYFQNGGRFDHDWQQLAVLKNEDNRMVHDWLIARPGSTQSELRAGIQQTWSGSLTSLQRRILELRDAGLLREERRGRFVHYWPTSGKPQPS